MLDYNKQKQDDEKEGLNQRKKTSTPFFVFLDELTSSFK